MELRSNPFLVGLFTLAVIAAGVVFVFWMDRYGAADGYVGYRIVFSDDVTGLGQGAPVMFNGIRVGEVVEIDFAEDDPTQVVAVIRVSEETPIKVDTTAQLQAQGITGGNFIQLRSGRPDAQDLVEAWGEDSDPIIYADRSAFANVVEGVQQAVADVEEAAETLSRILVDNDLAIRNTVQNIEQFSEALAQNTEGVDEFLASASAAARRFDTLGVEVESLTVSLQERIEGIDPGALGRTVDNVDRFTAELADNADRITAFIEDATSAARQITVVADRLEDVVDNAAEISDAIDPDSISRTVANVEEFTGGLAGRTETVERLIDDAAVVAANLRDTSERVDAFVARLDGMVGEDSAGFLEDIAAAARSFRDLSDNLDTQVAGLRGDVTRAVDRSAEDFGAFVADGRRTLDQIDRILRDLQSNPARFVTGRGGSIPEHTPRR
ncbi:MAG: MlaD family protein [Pseudomonadota bacterium]